MKEKLSEFLSRPNDEESFKQLDQMVSKQDPDLLEFCIALRNTSQEVFDRVKEKLPKHLVIIIENLGKQVFQIQDDKKLCVFESSERVFNPWAGQTQQNEDEEVVLDYINGEFDVGLSNF